MAYKVGFRDPQTGKFSLPVWQQLAWTNNKGKSPVKLTGVKAYAFRETPLGGSPFRAVVPADIVPVEQVKYEATDTLGDEVTGAAMDTRLLRVYCDPAAVAGL